MKRVTGIFTGKKLELEEFKNKEGKLKINLYILSGHDSLKITVNDNELWKELKAVPDMENIELKAEVQEYKGELYLQALELVG